MPVFVRIALSPYRHLHHPTKAATLSQSPSSLFQCDLTFSDCTKCLKAWSEVWSTEMCLRNTAGTQRGSLWGSNGSAVQLIHHHCNTTGIAVGIREKNVKNFQAWTVCSKRGQSVFLFPSFCMDVRENLTPFSFFRKGCIKNQFSRLTV